MGKLRKTRDGKFIRRTTRENILKFTYPNEPIETYIAWYESENYEFWMYLAAFLGLPSRPEGFKNGSGKIIPGLTFKQFCKNLIGGFDWADNTSRLKKFLQVIAFLPIKIGLILPFKIASFPFKLFSNLVKFLAFFIFPLMVELLIYLCNFILTVSVYIIALLFFPLIIIPYMLFIVIKIVEILLLIVSVAIKVILEVALLPIFILKFTYSIHPIIGLLTFGLILLIWAIAIPILMSLAVTLFPALASAVAFVTQIPIIASAFSATSGVFAVLSASIGAFFVPYVTFWAGVFGITLSSGIVSLAGAATLGFFVALIAIPASYLADAFSDRWAAWHEEGFFSAFFGTSPNRYAIVYEESMSESYETTLGKSLFASTLRSGFDQSYRDAESSVKATDGRLNHVSSKTGESFPRTTVAQRFTSGSVEPVVEVVHSDEEGSSDGNDLN